MFPDQQNANSYAQMPAPSRRSNSYFVWFAVALVLFLAAAGLAVWLYFDSNDLRNNFDGEVAQAVTQRETEIREEVQAEFDEEAKLPYRSVKLVESLGGVTVSYPKTWSIYAIERDSNTKPLDLYGQPDYVPDTSGDSAFALRMEITSADYEEEIDDYSRFVERGETTARPFRSNGVLGTRFDGAISSRTQGIAIVLPLRDKTMTLWTESQNSQSDFLEIAESLKFQP